MWRFILEISAATALTIGAILASATGVSASDVVVKEAFARASATPVARAAVAYVTIENTGSQADKIVSISSPAATSADLHQSAMHGDVMHMQAVGSVAIPAGGTLKMKPGGLHIMLVGLKAPLKQGDMVEVVLILERSGRVSVQVPVGTASADAAH